MIISIWIEIGYVGYENWTCKKFHCIQCWFFKERIIPTAFIIGHNVLLLVVNNNAFLSFSKNVKTKAFCLLELVPGLPQSGKSQWILNFFQGQAILILFSEFLQFTQKSGNFCQPSQNRFKFLVGLSTLLIYFFLK